ncbi:hypothetical protein [Halorubellus sp. PRR65]|uniref:hypothetical protein n=1 Tax=Halorubellus sp. PRR65 TaxID=3098148 RepID=UPI002B2592BA|nr:hypothetical protein [Halorubellus sp. PRR65]
MLLCNPVTVRSRLSSMHYFGDVSGHLRNLLHGDCEVCVFGVVGGDNVSAGRCAKRAVRRIDDIPEAKWNDLTSTQKRRFFDCLADQQDTVEYGYSVITKGQLHSMDNYHLLYQDVDLTWDLAFTGYVYGEILFEMGATEERRALFTFDRVASKKQCEKVKTHLSDFIPDVKVYYEGSRQSNGIQSADCLAGGIAEDTKAGTDWMSELETDAVTKGMNSAALAHLEKSLSDISAGP